MTDDRPKTALPLLHRRGAFIAIAAAGFGVLWGGPRLARFFTPLRFEQIADPPGFRRIVAGETSGLPSPFIGLDTTSDTNGTIPVEAVRANLCNGLFGEQPFRDVVPIASFSDYNCPFCRILTDRLTDLEAKSAGTIRITWHEWPRLGETSVAAARAALAADMQGAYPAFHKRLMRGRFVATPDYVQVLARDIGVDADRLIADMNGDAVSERLLITQAVAQIFGLIGTPSLVVGRTVIVGNVSQSVLTAVIDEERRLGPMPGCAP